MTNKLSYLIKKDLRLSQNVLQFRQFQEITFQCFGILIDFTQFIFQFLKRCLFWIRKQMKSTIPLFVHSKFKIFTSRSIISLGCGASGLSPVSNIGIPSFLISFSKYRSFRSISSQRRTSLTNFRWNAFTSGLSWWGRNGIRK